MKSYEGTPASKFESQKVQDFIKDREIKPEHFEVIQKLLDVPKNNIIQNFHNFFQLYKEGSMLELRRQIEHASNQELKETYKLFLEICESYEWTTAWNLVVMLEKI